MKVIIMIIILDSESNCCEHLKIASDLANQLVCQSFVFILWVKHMEFYIVLTGEIERKENIYGQCLLDDFTIWSKQW